METILPKVEYNKIVTIRYRDPKEKPIRVCVVPEEEQKRQNEENLIYISPKAPVAKAILNRSVGEEVDVITPERTYRIVISQID
ncbi:GreA/GreB family elongation factor [Candidatus Daviesbacteria bacterium]|nr:GreA/GreB family elongation factor [Candidatus Daviesbacteria bacterium]